MRSMVRTSLRVSKMEVIIGETENIIQFCLEHMECKKSWGNTIICSIDRKISWE